MSWQNQSSCTSGSFPFLRQRKPCIACRHASSLNPSTFSPFFFPLPYPFLLFLLWASPFPLFPLLFFLLRRPFPLQRLLQAIRTCQGRAGASSAQSSGLQCP